MLLPYSELALVMCTTLSLQEEIATSRFIICNNKDDDNDDKHLVSTSRCCASLYQVLPLHSLNLYSNDFMK